MLLAFLDVAVDDLNTAIHLLLEVNHSDSSARMRCLFEAAKVLRIRYYIMGFPKDLAKAVKLMWDALPLSVGDAQFSSRCEAYCAALLDVFAWFSDESPDALQEALKIYDKLTHVRVEVPVRISN